MEKQFVTYEIALKIKELGFDEECYGVFVQEKGNVLVPISNIYYTGCALLKHIKAPLWQQVIDFLIDVYELEIMVKSWKEGGVIVYLYSINVLGKPSSYMNQLAKKTYNEAREQAILKAIELCKN